MENVKNKILQDVYFKNTSMLHYLVPKMYTSAVNPDRIYVEYKQVQLSQSNHGRYKTVIFVYSKDGEFLNVKASREEINSFVRI